MEMEARHYASKGVGGSALGLAIGALGLEFLRGGNGIGGILGGGNNCYSREDAAKDARIAELTSEVKLRDANTYTDGKLLELYRYVDGRFNGVEAQICQQSVVNAQVTANLACLTNQVNVLNGLTKTVIPIASICPTPAVATTTTTG